MTRKRRSTSALLIGADVAEDRRRFRRAIRDWPLSELRDAEARYVRVAVLPKQLAKSFYLARARAVRNELIRRDSRIIREPR